MLHDFMMWRGDAPFLREQLPVARSVLDFFLNASKESGLVHGLAGWNFLDWVPGWPDGVPPGGADTGNASLNWQVVLALREAAALESWCGEPALTVRFHTHAANIENCIQAAFWNEDRGMFAEDLAQKHYAEHAQCLAVLAGGLPPQRLTRVRTALLNAPQLARTTVYFSHYLFEAYRLLGCGVALKARLEPWFNMPHMGLKTTIESPEPARSDCHGWAAHPLFHWYATLLGVRPDSPGFTRVVIAPMPDTLSDARATMVHPNGEILIELRQTKLTLEGRVILPPGISGKLKWRENTLELHAGANDFQLRRERSSTEL